MRAAAAFRNYLRSAEGRPFLAATAALFALGIALRAAHLFDVIRLDEATTYLLFASRPFGEALSSYQLPNNHLLNTVLVKFSVIAFGPEPWSLRLPNFLAGIGAMALVAAIAELPPVTRVVVGGWFQDTVKYYLMLNGGPADAIDRHPPQAFTFDAYVLVPPYSTPRWETDRYFQYGPMPIVRCDCAVDVEGFGIWKAVLFNPR